MRPPTKSKQTHNSQKRSCSRHSRQSWYFLSLQSCCIMFHDALKLLLMLMMHQQACHMLHRAICFWLQRACLQAIAVQMSSMPPCAAGKGGRQHCGYEECCSPRAASVRREARD